MESRYKKQEQKEEFAIVLDVILQNQHSFKETEVAQSIGKTNYTLLELVPKPGVELRTGDEVYIGEGKRDEIKFIKRAIKPENLTASAKSELEFTLMDIIDEKEETFVSFFNNAGPITIRKHSLELITGIGKKHLRELLDERDTKPFESFKDMSQRCSFLHNPQKVIAERIKKELDAPEGIKLFVKK